MLALISDCSALCFIGALVSLGLFVALTATHGVRATTYINNQFVQIVNDFDTNRMRKRLRNGGGGLIALGFAFMVAGMFVRMVLGIIHLHVG